MSPPFGEVRMVPDVAGAFAELVAQAIAAWPDPSPHDPSYRPFHLVLSGGSTARTCYERLARDPTIAWERVHCLVGDERCVPPDDNDANQRLIQEVLIDVVRPRPQFSPMDCGDRSAYERILRRSTPLELVHLGFGPDGHIASLFPGSPGLDAPKGALVVANRDPSGTNPHDRLTLTYEALGLARLVVFTISGTAKHEAVRRLFDGEDLPAARVRATRVVWLIDHEALGDAQARSLRDGRADRPRVVE